MEGVKFFIDTSIIISHFRKSNKSNSDFVFLAKNYDLVTSSLCIYELINGSLNAQIQSDLTFLLKEVKKIAFSTKVASQASVIYNRLKRKSKLVPHIDIMIAATAMQINIQLATHNLKHLERIEGLKIFDLNNKK